MKNFFSVLLILSIAATLQAQQGVGIGTTNPHASAILELNSTTKGLLLPRMTTSQRTGIGAVGGLVVYDTDYKEFYQHDGVSWRKLLNSNFWNSSATRSWIYNLSDSVGIGTSSPDEKLHVINGNFYMQDNRTGKNPHVIFDVPATNFKEGGLQFKRLGDTLAAINYIENTSVPNYVKVAVSSSGRGSDLVVNSNGNTGLGLANPEVKLHVYDRLGIEVVRLEAEAPMIQFKRRTSLSNQIPVTFADIGFIQTSGDNIRIGTNSSNAGGKFVVRTGGGDRLFVDEAGNVTIGTATVASGYMLNVGGKAICEELKVQLEGSWPDYVFSNDYKLPSIQDVAAFVEKNKHLPNIPPASEIEKNGLEVGDMQRKMIEKIEELTLYIIDLQKQIDELKKKGSK